MVTKRTPINRATRSKITPQMVAQFMAVKEIWSANDEAQWEEQGGRRREYLDTSHALHAALGRRPWQCDITNTINQSEPPAWMPADRIEDWHQARAIRLQIEQAAKG